MEDSPLVMVKMDITKMELSDEEFDSIICLHVLEHVDNDILALKELYRVLKKSGCALIGVPIEYNIPQTVEYGHPLQADSGHVRRYGIDFIQRLESAGFVVSNVVGEGLFHVIKGE